MSGWRLIGMVLLYPALVLADLPNTQQLIEQLKSTNSADVVLAARQLATQADDNAITAILARVGSEISSHTPQVQLAGNLIQIVSSVASEKYIPTFQKLKDAVEENKENIGRARRVLRRALGQASSEVRNRPSILKPEARSTAVDSSLPFGVRSFQEYLTKAAAEPTQGGPRFGKNQMPATAEGFLLKSIARNFTDELRRSYEKPDRAILTGRDEEIAFGFNVMVRPQARLAVYVGVSGVGKTATTQMMAEKAFLGQFPDSQVFRDQLKNAEFLLTSPAKISQMALSNEPTAQAAAVELFFEAIRKTQSNYEKKNGVRKPLIVVIDNLQTFDPPQLAALKQEVENAEDPICVVGTASTTALDLKLKTAPDIEKDIEKIPLREYDREETRRVLNETLAPTLAKRYNVTFDNDTLDAVFRVSAYLKPNQALPEAPLRALEDIAIAAHAAHPSEAIRLSEKDVYDYAQKVTHLPVDPRDAVGFSAYLQTVREKLEKRVDNQPYIIKAAVEGLERVLANNPKRPASMLFGGPTGVGKTLVGEALAEFAFGDKGRFFELDGTAVQQGGFSLSAYFGLPIGVKGSELTSGKLMEWLDDPARGKYGGVILINEADKMPLEVWQRLMEFQSAGVIYGGDGKPRYANRHILIFTSNKGAKVIFPESVLQWSQQEVMAQAASVTEEQLKNMLQTPDPNAVDPNATILTPELVGRIQRAALALPVTRATSPNIARLEVGNFLKKFKDDYGIDVHVAPAVEQYMAQTGINYLSGARPIGDQIERYFTPALTLARKNWGLQKNTSIEIDLQAPAPSEPAKLVLKTAGQSPLTSDAPMVPNENPMLDPEEQEFLLHGAEIMHKYMPEQPEAVDAIMAAVKGKRADDLRKRPVSIAVVGRVGLGKTELARALAFARYKSADRATIIPLSDVVDEKSWWNVFVPQFRAALQKNPQGGVIALDEFSNIGGGKGEHKTTLLMKFLNMLEEGVWEGIDLRKYIFMFSGNDLQTLTQGLTADEDNLEVWRRNNSRSNIEALLLAAGVPESFLSRQNCVLMIKPLAGQGKGNVAATLLDEYRKRLEVQHKGVKFTWNESFAAQMGEAFFTHARGARSMRGVNDGVVGALITDSLLKFGYDEKNLQGVELRFSIDDNLPKKAYETGDAQNFRRKVIVTAELFKNGELKQTLSADATADAQDVVVLAEEEAKMAAYRELGRLVLNDAAKTGLRPVYLTIRGNVTGGETVVGSSRYESTSAHPQTTLSKKTILARLKSFWGSSLALEKAGLDPDFGAERDLVEMRQMVMNYLLKSSTSQGFTAVLVDKDGQPRPTGAQSQALQTAMDKIFAETREQAARDLEKTWPHLEQLVKKLLDQGYLGGTELTGATSVCSQILLSQ